eukprot:186541-Rhodomonas_salina.1
MTALGGLVIWWVTPETTGRGTPHSFAYSTGEVRGETGCYAVGVKGCLGVSREARKRTARGGCVVRQGVTL